MFQWQIVTKYEKYVCEARWTFDDRFVEEYCTQTRTHRVLCYFIFFGPKQMSHIPVHHRQVFTLTTELIHRFRKR